MDEGKRSTMLKSLAAAVFVTSMAGSAAAAPLDFEDYRMQDFDDLVTVCGTPEEEAAQFCRGWLVGNGSLYATLVAAKAIRPWACADPVPTLDEIRRAVVAYGEANPQMGDQTAVDGFWRAAAAIWPCQE